MSNKVKELRGQLRQIVKEMMPELIASELYTSLTAENKKQLDLIHKLVRESLERMDDRQKDVQSIIMRELAGSRKIVEDAVAAEAPNKTE